MKSENRTPDRTPTLSAGLTIAAATLAMGACFLACTQTERKSGGPTERITIAYSTATDAVLPVIAQARGYYRQEGLEVTPHLHPYGKRALKEVLEGKADFATVAETPVMFEIMNGEKISVIATIQTSSKDNAVVVRKDRGIRTASDLKGRKLAVTSGTTADYFLSAFLAAQGILRKEIKVVDLKAEEIPDALADGRVDAASVFNPYIIQAQKKLGDRGMSFFDENLYTWTFNIVAKQEFIRKNPHTVKKILLALIKAEEFTMRHPAEAQKIVAGFGRLDMVLLRGIWADTTFRVALDQALVLALEDESRWAIKDGLTGAKKVPNYLDFIYFDGLKLVKPQAVGILR
jgi:sulfonate transport system substrate-binding protein